MEKLSLFLFFSLYIALFSDILKEWDYDKNTIKPSEISSGSGLNVWWRCSKNHSFNTAIYNKVKGIGCPYCSNRKVLKGFNDLATTNPELLREWDYDKNKFKPEEMISGTDKKVWWKCSKCGHEWQAVIHSRAVGHGCPVCGHEKVGSLNAKIKDQKNSLINKFPNVIKVWNYEKNINLKPEDFLYMSNKKVWWICSECGKEWQSSICSKPHTIICRECAHKNTKIQYVKEGINDLETTNPEMLKEWNY